MPGLHLFQITGEMILSCQGVHAWKMVYPLIWLHSVELVNLYRTIRPEQVPLTPVSLAVASVRLRDKVVTIAILCCIYR